MRKALSLLYRACGALAGLFMVAIAAFILFEIGGGLFGYVARSADEFAGYCMASSSFLALAYTFGAGEHIRVSLFLQRLPPRSRRAAEFWCLAAGSYLSGYLAWFSVKMVYVSWQLNDVSQGLVATPLWIPQLGMAVGSTVFFIAVLERLADLLLGGAVLSDADGDSRTDR